MHWLIFVLQHLNLGPIPPPHVHPTHNPLVAFLLLAVLMWWFWRWLVFVWPCGCLLQGFFHVLSCTLSCWCVYCLFCPLSHLDTSLTFTTLWAFSADDKLMIFFLFFPENRIRHFTQIVSYNLHEMLYPVFWEK